MKEIVFKGHKFMQTSCKICGCVFKFEDEDIEKEETVEDNSGCPCATDYILTCPYCNKQISVRDTCDVKKLF